VVLLDPLRHRQWDKDLWSEDDPGPNECLRRRAGDGVVQAIDFELLANDIGVAPEPRLPATVAPPGLRFMASKLNIARSLSTMFRAR
jgi:hypothetical protein